MDINIATPEGKFIYRVAGILINKDRVLLETSEGVKFWAPPGGTVGFGESSIKALKREFQEELDIEINVERMLWITEGFFDYNNRKTHSIVIYYLVTTYSSKINDFTEPFYRKDNGEHGTLMTFEWYQLDEIEKIPLLPEFLKDKLRTLPNNIEHIIHN